MDHPNNKKIEIQPESLLPVVVVEDDEGLNYILCKSLTRSGFTVDGVQNGAEAIAHVRQNPEVLMLLDLQLPDMSGMEVIDQLTKEGITVAFIVMTGHGDESVAVAMMKKGAKDYLVKDGNFLGRIPIVITRVSQAICRDKELAATRELLTIAANQWKITFDSISDAVCLLAKDQKIIRCNQAMRDLLGKSWTDIIGHDCCQLLHGHPGPIVDCPYQRAIKSKQKETTILSVEDRFLEILVFPVLDESGNMSGAVHIVRDITDTQATEKKLRDSINNLDEAVRAGRIGLWDWDLKTNKVNFSSEWKRQIGYQDDEIGDDFSELEKRIHPDDLQSTIATIEKSIKEVDQEYRTEFRFRHKNGSYRWILAQASFILDEEGSPLKMVGSHIDITSLKKLESAFRQSQLRYRTMIESMTDAIYICSADLLVEYMNPKMIERVGRDATGEPCYKALHGLDQQCDGCVIDMVLKGQTIENTIVSPLDDNHYRITNMPIINSNETVSKMGIYRDITEYMKAVSEKENSQRQLAQSQKMESIGTLAGGIAHDFNNILSAVLGYTELALSAVEKETPMEDDLKEVYTAGLRAKDLVRQILTFARQTDDELQPIQVDFIIKEVLKFVRSTIPSTIEIKQNLTSDSLVMGCSTQIHRIMMNLCANAAYAMEDTGGTLEITVKDVTLDHGTMGGGPHLNPGNYIEIKVSDTGGGIEPQIIDKIFEPYFTTKGPGEGTGMGLAMVYSIIETYKGKIFVESTLGRGTLFTVYLPAIKRKKPHLPSISSELLTGKERILIVDDEPSIVEIASRILGQLGYSVTTRTSSVEALELFRSKPSDYDLVISDMTMPKMTGDRLIEKLIEIRPNIPVILCTGYSKKFSEKRASTIGVKAFVKKPIVQKDLAKTVRRVLDEAQNATEEL